MPLKVKIPPHSLKTSPSSIFESDILIFCQTISQSTNSLNLLTQVTVSANKHCAYFHSCQHLARVRVLLIQPLKVNNHPVFIHLYWTKFSSLTSFFKIMVRHGYLYFYELLLFICLVIQKLNGKRMIIGASMISGCLTLHCHLSTHWTSLPFLTPISSMHSKADRGYSRGHSRCRVTSILSTITISYCKLLH